jgi:hypothetical protein
MLFLLVVLLAPSLAYAGSPSADLSVQIVPPAPPGIPAVPAGAKAAGFTTLAANYDFTIPFGQSGGLPTNWLGCAPHDGAVHSWYQGIYSTSQNWPCAGRFTQVTDPLTGTMALQISWVGTDYNPECGGSDCLNVAMMTTEDSSSGGSRTTTFPNAYFEIVYRATPTTTNSPDSPTSAFWQLQNSQYLVGFLTGLELDHIEMYGANLSGEYGSAVHDWAGGGSGGNPNQFVWHGARYTLGPSYDPSKYHTYAGRLTSDGSTRTAYCVYVDGSQYGCVGPWSMPGGANEYANRNFLILNTGGDNQSRQMYVQRITVWSCAQWQTQICNGTALTGTP